MSGGNLFSTTWQLVKLILILATVGGLAYFTTRYLGRRMAGGGGRHLRLVDGVALGPNRSVCLIRTPASALVVGVTGEGISLLERITEPGALAVLDATPGSTPGGPGGQQGKGIERFRERLRREIEKLGTLPLGPGSGENEARDGGGKG